MDDQPVTRESLREFLSSHRNWAETSPGVFECCIEDPCWPTKIELEDGGALFTFRKDAAGDWAFVAGQSRRCPYTHLHIVPPDSSGQYSGSIMMDLRVQVLPPGQPKPATEPLPPLGPRMNIPLHLPDEIVQRPRPPDWPDLRPPD